MSLTVKSPISSQSVKKEPALYDVMKILKSQESKLVAISIKLSIHENKTDSIMVKLDELTLNISNLRNEKLRTQIPDNTLRLCVNSLDILMCNNCTNPDIRSLVCEVHELITKSNNTVIFNVVEEPNNSELSLVKLA